MPVNASAEYFIAEKHYQDAKGREEKLLALEEMIRTCPKHKGAEHLLATLKSKYAKMKKEAPRKGGRKVGIRKEGDAQVCIIGEVNSGKSTLLAKLTGTMPKISSIPYTTVVPEIGTLDYSGIKIQVVEIPSTFDPEYLSIARTSDLVLVLANSESVKARLKAFLEENYVRQKKLFVSSSEPMESVRQRIWSSLGMIIAYAKKTRTPMALKKGSTVAEFAARIHKDLVKNFSFARIERMNRKSPKAAFPSGIRIIQAGLNYPLEDGDVVEIHTK